VEWYTLVQFLGATVLLVATPGPIMATIAHNTLRHGTTAGFLTVIGVELGDACLLGAALASLVLSGDLLTMMFRWLSLAGAFYLVWLAARALAAQCRPLRTATIPRNRRPLLDGLAIVFANPSRLLFYTAFFPQFIDPGQPIPEQLLVLTVIYAGAVLTVEYLWVVAAARLRTPAGWAGIGRLAEVGSAVIYLSVATVTLFGFVETSG
jgi:threonine/homoserine/homoserine lactone efflux protein